jgi:LPS O-antigen subunit length determinant protein (WzzB/FepE family)
MVDFVNDDSLIASLDEQMRIIWGARFLISICAIVAALAGCFGALLLPKTHETSVVVRPQSSSEFVEFAGIMAQTPQEI